MTLTLLPFLFACNSDTTTTDSGQDEDPAEHACEVFEDGETTPVTAGDAADNGDELDPSEAAFSVTLIDDGTGVYSGYVILDVHEAELDALLFAGTADVVNGLWLDGADVGLPTPAPNEFCGDDIVEHWEMELTEGEYALELGPAAVDSLWLMFMEAEGHGHDED
jgi:hypothetical protein